MPIIFCSSNKNEDKYTAAPHNLRDSTNRFGWIRWDSIARWYICNAIAIPPQIPSFHSAFSRPSRNQKWTELSDSNLQYLGFKM